MNPQMFLPGLAPVQPAHPVLRTESALPDVSLPALFNYPDVAGTVRSRGAKAIGRAGESLTDAVLFRLGLESFAAGEDAGYDRLIGFNHPATGFVRLATAQIKTVTQATNGHYRFNMTCGYRGSPQGRRSYPEDAFDIAALVILPRNAVCFTYEKWPVHKIAVSEVTELVARPQDSLLRALRAVFAAKAARSAALDPDAR